MMFCQMSAKPDFQYGSQMNQFFSVDEQEKSYAFSEGIENADTDSVSMKDVAELLDGPSRKQSNNSLKENIYVMTGLNVGMGASDLFN